MANPRESVLCVKIHRYMGNLDHEGLNWDADHAWEMLEPVVALEQRHLRAIDAIERVLAGHIDKHELHIILRE